MSLVEKLKAISTGASSRIPPDKRAIMAEATQDLRSSGIMDGVIQEGATLPPFALTNQAGETVRSEDILAKGPMVLTVFRGVW